MKSSVGVALGVPDRLSWEYADRVLEEIGFLDPDTEEDFYSILYRLAGDPRDPTLLVEEVPFFKDLLTVRFRDCFCLYRLGEKLSALLLVQTAAGTFDAGSGGPSTLRL